MTISPSNFVESQDWCEAGASSITVSLEPAILGEVLPSFFTSYGTEIGVTSDSVEGEYNLRLIVTAEYATYEEITFTWTILPNNEAPVPSFEFSSAEIYSV